MRLEESSELLPNVFGTKERNRLVREGELAGEQANSLLAERLHETASQQLEQRRPQVYLESERVERLTKLFDADANTAELSHQLLYRDHSAPLDFTRTLADPSEFNLNDFDTLTASSTIRPSIELANSHDESSGPFGHECLDSPTSSSITHFANCNTSNSQLLLMNISTEDLNFSSINEVWLVKSWQEILLRVSIVAPIVLLGLIGNLTIIYWMARFKPIRSRPTNIFILNMALADLLTSIVCPNAALLTDIFQFYVLGAFLCRFEGFIKITCLLVSAYSLIVLSFDWFLCVVKPCRRRITIKQSWLTLAAIWIVSVAAASPLLYWRNLRERQWKDLVEVWCCEHIQYTKYYWVGMTLFLIYLPTFIMTIVLVVILVQMDKFEAKLKRSRCNTTTRSMSTASITTDLTYMAATPSNASVVSLGLPSGTGSLNNSLSISMKYRRRIVKILFFYLLTSIVCWTPLQFVIVYRHFRAEAVPANWFFELAFWSQLCASLSAALNPMIFGFLSQPFRRIVTKSWMFRFCDKFCSRRALKSQNNGKLNQFAMGKRAANKLANDHNQHNGIDKHNLNYARSSHRTTPDLEQPKLTLEYIDPQQLLGRSQTGAGSSKRISTISTNQLNPQRPAQNSASNQHHRHHHRHHHHHHHRKSHIDVTSQSINANLELKTKVKRSHSSRNSNVETDNNELSIVKKGVSVHDQCTEQSPGARSNGSIESGARENVAFVRDENDLGQDDKDFLTKSLTPNQTQRSNGASLSNGTTVDLKA